MTTTRRFVVSGGVVLLAVFVWKGRIEERRVAVVPTFKGEALVPQRPTADADVPNPYGITLGNRAMSFRVNSAVGISALIHRDSRVDVLLLVDGSRG